MFSFMDDATKTATEPRPPDAIFAPEDDVGALLVQAYQGEVSGEVLFGIVASGTDDPERRRKFEVLTRLEAKTREACLPAMRRHGLPTDPDPKTVADAKVLGEAVLGMTWEQLLSSFEPITSQFLALYRRIGEISEADRAESGLLVAHEQALMDFARRELAGETETSLELIEALPHLA